jgi:hypothetical protein
MAELDLQSSPDSEDVIAELRRLRGSDRLPNTADSLEAAGRIVKVTRRRRHYARAAYTLSGAAVVAGIVLLVINLVPAGSRHDPTAAVGAPQGGGTHPSGQGDTLSPAGQIQTAEELRQVARADSAYASLRYRGGHTFTIYRAAAQQTALEARYRAAVPGVDLSFQRAMLSQAQTEAISTLIDDAGGLSYFTRHGVKLQSYGPKPPGPFVIGYSGDKKPDDRLLSPFLEYGAGTVVFVKETPLLNQGN